MPHNQKQTDQEIEERFWSYVQIGGPDECWLWTGTTNNSKCGVFSANRKTLTAHVYALKLAGVDTEDRKKRLYIIRKPGCVGTLCCNVKHMTVDRDEDRNTQRHNASVRDTLERASRTHFPCGHERTDENTTHLGGYANIKEIGKYGGIGRCRLCYNQYQKNLRYKKHNVAVTSVVNMTGKGTHA